MTTALQLKPVFTTAGLAAMQAAHAQGLAVKISHVALGDALYDIRDLAGNPLETARAKVALSHEQLRVPLGPLSSTQANQVVVQAEVSAGDPPFWIGEVGFVTDTGVLLAVWSAGAGPLGWRSIDVPWLIKFVLAWTDLPANSITVVMPEDDAALTALALDLDRVRSKVRHTVVTGGGLVWSDTDSTQLTTAVGAMIDARRATTAPAMNGVAAVGAGATFARADHVHPTDTSRAALASPALTGTPTAPTAAVGTNTTQIATTAFVGTAVNASAMLRGLHSIWVPAAAMRPAKTGGCAPLAATEIAAGQPDLHSLDFDPATTETAQFSVHMPKSWDRGTIQVQAVWCHAATTTNFGVVWSMAAVAVGDGDTLGAAYGAAVTLTDVGGGANTVYVTARSGALTVAGNPQIGDLVAIRVQRAAADAADTMTVDARLVGVSVIYTVSAGSDD